MAEYVVFVAGPVAILEIRFNADDIGDISGGGSEHELVKLGDSYFRRSAVLAVVPASAFRSRSAIGKPG